MNTLCKLCMLILIVAAVGCEDDPAFDPAAQAAAAGVTPRSQWQVRGRDIQDAELAIDGNMATRATTSSSYGSAALTIDLGDPSLFNMLVLEHGSDDMGFAQRVGVSTSLDGQSYTRRAIAPGNRRVTIVCIVTPVLARYVRIEAMKPGQRPWSLAEVQLK